MPSSTPKTCRYCTKAIVIHPGTDRYRSTEHGIAIDRMACLDAPDRRHRPAETAEMRRVTVQAPPREPQFRTGGPA